ncbi:MAG TPA: serine hydrolase domain-containing protein [Thermoanaerobaculia bacterium]|nr:serine hydrolase domain-containing protein [Thermoanaerobaculia bacterium]
MLCRSLPLLLLTACSVAVAPNGGDPRAAKVLSSLAPAFDVAGRTPVRWTLDEEMAKYQVPGVSIAVVDGDRIWSSARGVLQAGGVEPVTEHSVFQAASISKVIAATMTLRLVDEKRLDLDTDVNLYLRSWKVPESPYTDREKVTLRRLLSHTAGTSVHGFFGYAADEPKPTLLQVLDAQPPAKNKPIRVVAVPGSATSYSGGGIAIEQLVLTDVTGRPFPDLARELVFAPLQMEDSTFEQPLPNAMRARAARGHDQDGRMLPGGWHIGPEMAAGWMWTSATDLMRWAMAIADARDGKPRSILSRSTATAMLTPQKDLYGLGSLLEGTGRAFSFSHGGNNPGYTTQVTYFPETRQGIAILTNKVGADLLIDEITRAVASEYGWPAHQPGRVTPAALNAADLSRIAGDYALHFPGAPDAAPATVRLEDGRLYLDAAPIITHDEVVAVTPSRLVSPAWGYSMDLQRNDRGEVTAFRLTYGDNVLSATRKP